MKKRLLALAGNFIAACVGIQLDAAAAASDPPIVSGVLQLREGDADRAHAAGFSAAVHHALALKPDGFIPVGFCGRFDGRRSAGNRRSRSRAWDS